MDVAGISWRARAGLPAGDKFVVMPMNNAPRTNRKGENRRRGVVWC